MNPGQSIIQPDVLIIGGGVQGLWLLKDLIARGYLALLLERRELGGEQTNHSHVYLHQGHLYSEVVLAAGAQAANVPWNNWLATQTPVVYGVGPSYYGFRTRKEADDRKALWEDPQLGLAGEWVDPLPAPLADGTITAVLQSPEKSLDGGWLMRALLRNVADYVSRIDDVRNIRVNVQKSEVEGVEIATAGKKRARFRPGALVLAAGAGNQALLERASGGHRPLLGRVSGAQQIRKAHMLVVRGNRADLPPLTGVFPDGLFIVSRCGGDLGDETVWLISDNRSQPIAFPEDWIGYDPRWWLPRVLAALADIARGSFVPALRDRLRWGIYEAPKAEGRAGGAIPQEERIEQFGIRNLWAIWPTKLTLAPVASRKVVSAIGRLLAPSVVPPAVPPPPPPWRAMQVAATVAPERWRKIPLVSWDEFRRCYDL